MDRWEFRIQICPLLSALESCSSTKHALQIHAQLLLTGLYRRRLPLSKLISFLALSGPCGLRHSHLLFSQLKLPNIFIYNTMIRGYSLSDSPEVSIFIFKGFVREGKTKPNNFTFPFLLKACARLPRAMFGFQVHSHIARSGFESHVEIKNSLLHFYSSFEELANAHCLFDEIPELGIVSFNIMISCYARCHQMHEALWLFRRMLDSEMKPDRFTFASLLSVCLVSRDQQLGRAIHLLALKYLGKGYAGTHFKGALVDMYAKLGMMRMAKSVFESMGDEKNAKAWSSMVSGYARAGEIDAAIMIFDEMPQRDLISWTAMISGCSQTGRYIKALKLFAEMETVGLKPDEVTIVALLSACAKLGALKLGRRLHLYAEEELNTGNGILCAALVDMYAKCGCTATALDIFNQVDGKLKTVSLFNSMLSGLAQDGLGEKALAVFREMEKLELIPDEITFVGVLCACSHSGLIEDGRKLFEAMQMKYRIRPQIEHYGCMVDLFGRVGLIQEAYELAAEMPMKANPLIWSSLLRACRIHKNTKVKELAEKQLKENSNLETKSRHLFRVPRSRNAKMLRKVRKNMYHDLPARRLDCTT